MPNAIEELNKLIQRLEMLFQVQTHEVVQDLKRIRDIMETPEEIIYAPSATKGVWHGEERENLDIRVKLEQPSEIGDINLGDATEENSLNNDNRVEPIEEIKEEIKEDKSELVKQYIEKFNKKPFAGWSVEVIKEKLGE